MPKVAFDALMQQISTLQATVDRLTAIIEEKNQIILNQNRARFGQSSEKRTYLLADGQLSMFEQVGNPGRSFPHREAESFGGGARAQTEAHAGGACGKSA